MMKRDILRIIDVNVNRSREGLRVCEEVARFVLHNRTLTQNLKNLRHRVRHICDAFPEGWHGMIDARDSKADVGRHADVLEMKRADVKDVFIANMQRSKESMRVLEECCKLFDAKLSHRFRHVRFTLYETEKRALTKL
jgi:thiamine-phosphate pyrophosphorylase